jgi:hypothetical protein
VANPNFGRARHSVRAVLELKYFECAAKFAVEVTKWLKDQI